MCTCLPVGFLKFFINIGAIITLVLAVLVFGATVFGFTDASIWGNSVDNRNKILISLLIVSIILFFMGLAGVLGAYKRNKCLLTIFSIGSFLFLFIFLTIGIISFYLPSSIIPQTCSQPQNYWNSLSAIANKSQAAFCKLGCQCYDKLYPSYNLTVIGNLAVKGFYWTSQDETAPTQYQKCPLFNKQQTQVANLLGLIQQQFKCSGWCDSNYTKYFYMFSDINKDIPSGQNCFRSMHNFIHKFIKLFAWISLGVAGVVFINLSLICGLCCHSSKKKQSSYYQRLA